MIHRKILPRLVSQLYHLQVKNYSSELKSALKNAEIIPDVICKAPKFKACVDFKDASVDLGNVIPPCSTECQPKVTWETPCGYFLLIMLNPDLESRKCPILRHFVHWLVGNIQGPDIKSGETLMEYIGAVPAKGTGCHRMVFLVYAQKKKIDNFCIKKICKDSACGRDKFQLEAFAKKFSLCDPYAVNFFHTESDSFSEKLRKQLTENSKKQKR